VVSSSKNVGNRLPKIGSLFPAKSTMELYKYSMLNTKTSNQLWSKTMETYATNAKTGEKYSGENWGTLTSEQSSKNYKSNTWATYLQWNELGRKIVKGEKGTNIFRPVKIPTGEIYKDTGEPKFKSVPKWWSVFNEEQTTEIVVN